MIHKGGGDANIGLFSAFLLKCIYRRTLARNAPENGGVKKKGTILHEVPPHSVVVYITCIFHFFRGIGRINNWDLRSLGITLPEIFMSRAKVMRKNCAHVLGAPAASARSGTWR